MEIIPAWKTNLQGLDDEMRTILVGGDDRNVRHVTLPPTSRLELVAERAERWPQPPLVEAQPDLLRNGVVRVAFGKKGWQFGFDAAKASVWDAAAKLLNLRLSHQAGPVEVTIVQRIKPEGATKP